MERLTARQKLEALVAGKSLAVTRRGPEVSQQAIALYSSDQSTWPRNELGNPIAQVNWGGLPVPLNKANLHFMVAGVPGTGKTVTIRSLLHSIASFDHPGLDRMVIYDPKQEFFPILKAAARERSRIVISNPFDCRCYAWDMAADFDSEADALQLAKLIVPCGPNVQNPFYPQAAASVIASVVATLMRVQKGAWDLFSVIRQCSSIEKMTAFIQSDGAESQASMMALSALSSGITRDNVFGEICSRLYEYIPLASSWRRAIDEGRKLSIKEFLGAKDCYLLLGANQRYSSSLQVINRLLLKRLAEMLLDSPQGTWAADNRTWIFLDELRELGDIPGLADLVNKGRSRGVCAVLGFQDYPGLKKSFGEDVAHELTASCAHKLFLRLQGDSSEWASKLIGKAEISETQFSYSGSSSFSISGSVGTQSGTSSSTSRSTSYGQYGSSSDGSSTSKSQSQSMQHGFSVSFNQAITASTQIRETDVVFASEISHLPNFHDAGGLTAYLCEQGAVNKSCVRRIFVPRSFFDHALTQSSDPGFVPWPEVGL